MKKMICGLTLAFVASLALAGCSLPSKKVALQADQRCADKVARAIASPDAPVAGALACVESDYAAARDWATDADLQLYAQKAPVVALDGECGAIEVDVVVRLGDEFFRFEKAKAFIYRAHAVQATLGTAIGDKVWVTLPVTADAKVGAVEVANAVGDGCP